MTITVHPSERVAAPVLAAIGRPLRAWSLIVTIFGDAVAPRGNSIWLGNLLDILSALDIDGGVVRTALSRLVADGWVERERVGRNSFYSLTSNAREQSQNAAARIYAPDTATPFQGWTLAVLPDPQPQNPTGDARTLWRAEIAKHGAGILSASTAVWLNSKQNDHLSDITANLGALQFNIEPSTADYDKRILAEAWPLHDLRAHYAPLLKCLDTLERAIASTKQQPLSDLDALALRTVLVHEWRRMVLRAPDLPAKLLPGDWPRAAAHARVARLYEQLSPLADRWLDKNARTSNGPLSQAASAIAPQRFK